MNMPLEASLPLLVEPEHIIQARSAAAGSGKRVVECLEELLNLRAGDFVAALGRALHYPVLDMDDMYALSPEFDLLPFTEALRHECILYRDTSGHLIMVFADPFTLHLRPWAEERIGKPMSWRLAHHQDIAAYFARYEESLRAMDNTVISTGPQAADTHHEDVTLKTISEDSSPVVKLVHSTLYDGLKLAASDIHLETTASSLIIRYRIDGVLTTVGTIKGTDLAEQVVSRIKIMSELDISERRVPQDGRFRISVRGREIDFRVSIMPSIFGEDAVLRILDKQSLSDHLKGLRLDNLGFTEPALAVLRRLSSEPYGMMLVTGPTGSGKTTTLYAAISEINHGRDKLVTIEDPVEYQLSGVLQIPVNEKKGLTFAKGLRSILRHDPDKIMVGEIRDPETAQIAIQAALTGHLVFTTVHANNVFDVIGRFIHMGVDPYSFVAAINGIVAQRLVRLNCPQCSVDDQLDPLDLEYSRIPQPMLTRFRLRVGRGCGHCRGTGYKGRKAIAETLILTDEIREMIVAREPLRRIKEAALQNGTQFLREAALELACKGETSLQEINRVTFAE